MTQLTRPYSSCLKAHCLVLLCICGIAAQPTTQALGQKGHIAAPSAKPAAAVDKQRTKRFTPLISLPPRFSPALIRPQSSLFARYSS